MTKLSTLKGFGATSGGSSGGGGTTYTPDIMLDAKSFTMQDEGKYLKDMNLDAYMQPFRVRGLDTATEAFFGLNLATRQGSSTGNMSHTAVLFSVNQTTGAITKKGSASLYNTSVSYDYSTFVATSDEWSGRYTYSGNIPRSGSSGHSYGYNQGLVGWNGSSVTVTGTNSSTDSTYYPNGNRRETSAYLSPTERRYGGAVTHILPMYTSANSRAMGVEHTYSYSTTAISASTSHSAPSGFTESTTTSTNYTVRHLWQWDVTNEPYYDYFHSMPEGLYARTRSTGNWSNIQSGGLDQTACVYHLSNGNLIVYYAGSTYMITSAGSKSTLTASGTQNDAALLTRHSSYGNCTGVVNIGTDEWLVAGMGGGWFWKFKINPTTGVVTQSNVLQSTSALFKTLGGTTSVYKYGFPGTANANYSSQMFTYGNEHASGNGYGRSKLLYVGGHDGIDLLHVASYDLSGIIDTLTYS